MLLREIATKLRNFGSEVRSAIDNLVSHPGRGGDDHGAGGGSLLILIHASAGIVVALRGVQVIVLPPHVFSRRGWPEPARP